MTKPSTYVYICEQQRVHKRSQRRMRLNLVTVGIFRIFTVLGMGPTLKIIKVMSKAVLDRMNEQLSSILGAKPKLDIAVELALERNMITVTQAIELGISENAIQAIHNKQVNDAYEQAFDQHINLN